MEIFRVGIERVGVILDGNFPGENFPGGSFPSTANLKIKILSLNARFSFN